MTATAIPPTAQPDDTPPVLALGAARLLAGVPQDRPLTHAEHLAATGAPIRRSQAWLVDAARRVGLLGRGGAAFPLATKLAAVPAGQATRVLVNGTESEPASRKDRVLMRRAPHRVIDGALVVGSALGTRHVTIAVHDRPAAEILAAACSERADAHHLAVVLTPGGFVAGEASALIHAVEGLPAVPDGRRVLPHVSGLGGDPTFVSNVETFGQLGLLATFGVADYAALGSTDEPGTSLVTMLGDVPRPGVAEVPNGVTLDLLTGPLGDKPALVGGYHGTWTSITGLRLDRRSLRSRGVSWGAGVLGVLPDTTCSLGEVTRVAHWLAAESAGQCGPCVFGLASAARDLAALHSGARVDLGGLRRRLGLVDGRGACGHPGGAVGFIASALDAYADEVAAHASGRGCGRPTLGVLPLPWSAA